MARSNVIKHLIKGNCPSSVVITGEFPMQAQAAVPANSNARVRLYNEADDLQLIEGWWAHQRDEQLNKLAFSNLGFIVQGEFPEAVGFLYETNSPRCFADFVMVNPSIPKEARKAAIEILMDTIISVAAGRGFAVMEIMVKNPVLQNRCEEKGFINLGGVTYMARGLWSAQ